MTLTVNSALVVSPRVEVIDGSKPGARPMSDKAIQRSTDQVLRESVTNASKFMEFMSTEFGRNGLDDKGSTLPIVVHAPDPMFGGPMSNAYWDGETGRMYLGDGDGATFTPLGGALDIIAHEAGHAILESEIKMGFRGEEGALHESFGDVLGVLVDPNDWQIAEDVFTPDTKGDAIRDVSKPAKYHHMDDVKGSAEAHDLADIPNLAAYRVAEKVGRKDMGQIWYHGMVDHLQDNGKFADAAQATLTAAEQLFGKDSSQTSAVKDAWTSVGVLRTLHSES